MFVCCIRDSLADVVRMGKKTESGEKQGKNGLGWGGKNWLALRDVADLLLRRNGILTLYLFFYLFVSNPTTCLNANHLVSVVL